MKFRGNQLISAEFFECPPWLMEFQDGTPAAGGVAGICGALPQIAGDRRSRRTGAMMLDRGGGWYLRGAIMDGPLPPILHLDEAIVDVSPWAGVLLAVAIQEVAHADEFEPSALFLGGDRRIR